MTQSLCDSVQKSGLYAILMILLDFPETLNVVTDSPHAEMVALQIKTVELIPDDSKLTLLFIQLQVSRNRNLSLCITYIRS